MARKKKKVEHVRVEDNYDKLKSFFTDVFTRKFISNLKDQYIFFVDKLQETVYLTEKGILERVIAVVFLTAGFIFLFIAFANYLIEVHSFPKSLSYFIISVILFIIPFFMKVTMFSKKWLFGRWNEWQKRRN